ncbi:MAG TPA: CBS domain-containing protein [Pirellulaceae bacterium]|nr:CBS domain-containing protein [Pirellulaceae bacterium]
MTETGLGTFVTYNPLAVSAETTADRLLEMVEQLHVRHFPVVEDGRLLGMISETDLLSALYHKAPLPAGTRLDQPLKAESLAMRHPVTIGPLASPRQALELLLAHGIHSLPVLSGERLLGIVTSSDFLREYSYGELPGSREPVGGHLPPHHDALDPDATLDEALLAMQETGQNHLAVVHGGCPVGIVSQADIVRARCRQPAIAAGRDEDDESAADQTATVAAVMHRTPPFRPGQRLCEAAAVMFENQLSALVVTNQANRFLGILTETDLLKLMLKQLR